LYILMVVLIFADVEKSSSLIGRASKILFFSTSDLVLSFALAIDSRFVWLGTPGIVVMVGTIVLVTFGVGWEKRGMVSKKLGLSER